jgi:ABC-type dipeptide/oligopeptide/nickel transport system ATPase component
MLCVSDLTISVDAAGGIVDVVSSVSFAIRKGEILGLSGVRVRQHDLARHHGPDDAGRTQSGAAQSLTASMTELPPYRRVEIGRGGIAMVFQSRCRHLIRP